MLAQVAGAKCVLFIANTEENWKKMKLHPYKHPHSRQSQIPVGWNQETQKFDLVSFFSTYSIFRVHLIVFCQSLLPEGIQNVSVGYITPGEV